MRCVLKDFYEMIIESNLPSVLGGLLVLLAGWLLALWLSGKVSAAVNGVQDFYHRYRGVEAQKDRKGHHIGNIAGRTAFWITMLIALLGCMSLLHLDYAAVPLREFMTTIIVYIPNIAGALLLLLLAWVLAGIVRLLVRRLLSREEFAAGSEKLSLNAGKSAETAAKTAYFLVYLFFLPAILNVLGIYGITAPLQSMFAVVLTYLPRAAGALLILFLGFWGARLVRRVVSGAIPDGKLRKFAESLGMGKIPENRIGNFFGQLAWILVAIPVTAAALTALDIDVLSSSVSGLFDLLLKVSINLAGAAAVMIGALICGRIADSICRKTVTVSGLERAMENSGAWKQGSEKYSFAAVVGKVAYISVVILGLQAACGVMNFTGLSELVKSFVQFGGNLILSGVILLAGMWLSGFLKGLLSDKSPWLAVFVRGAVIIFAVALALSNLGIGRGITELVSAVLLGSFGLAAGLAFGLGGREFAADMLAHWRKKLNGE